MVVSGRESVARLSHVAALAERTPKANSAEKTSTEATNGFREALMGVANMRALIPHTSARPECTRHSLTASCGMDISACKRRNRRSPIKGNNQEKKPPLRLAARGCPKGRAGRSARIKRRTFGGSRRHPAGCPSWRRRRKRKLIVGLNVDSVARGSQPARDGSTGGGGSNEFCRTSHCVSSAHPS
jgi:hypothetical protein